MNGKYFSLYFIIIYFLIYNFMQKDFGALLPDLLVYAGIYVIYTYMFYISGSLKIFHNLLLGYRNTIDFFFYILTVSRDLAELSL